MGGGDTGGGGGGGVTFSNDRPIKANKPIRDKRKTSVANKNFGTDALSQPMAGSGSGNPFSVTPSTRYKSTEQESGIGFRTDESGKQYAVRIDRDTGKTPSYAKTGKPSTSDRVDYSKALTVEKRFKAGKVMTETELDEFLAPEPKATDEPDEVVSKIVDDTKDKSQPTEGTDLSKAARRAQAQAQKGAKARIFYGNKGFGL